MKFESLSRYQILERYPAARKHPPGLTRKRQPVINCYVHPGEKQARYRITGSNLDSNSEWMMHAAMELAGSLLQATQYGTGSARVLISPARYSDRILEHYCNQLAKAAFSPRPTDLDGEDVQADLISPCAVPYLLGGITGKAVEDLCHRALEVMFLFGEEKNPKQSMQRALSVVGYGPGVAHHHYDEAPKKKHAHLSHRQEFLLTLPATGASYPLMIINQGAYADTPGRLIASYKEEIMTTVANLMDPEGGEMTPLAAKGRQPVIMEDKMYARAVRKVFEKSWLDLDLKGRPETAYEDAEVLIARQLIQRLAYNDKMSAESLVGISLLTGISIANWTAFANYDQVRRGETFITADEIERAIHMIEGHPAFNSRLESQLYGDATVVRSRVGGEQKWARRLQSPNRPLWSGNGLFYVVGHDENGVAKFKYQPFSLVSDK